MSYLPCEIIENGTDIDAAVIWLHGLGASGHDFVPIVPELRLPEKLAVRFIFPHAAAIPVTINGGMVMPAWYDILSMEMGRKIDTAQILSSAQAVIDLVERERTRGISSERIILAGFSQGGAVVYQAALAYPKPLAGLLAMSTYFATHETLQAAEANQHIPIHISHGSHDPVVPESMAKQAVEALQQLGYQPSFSSYPMAHEVHPQQIADISQWLQQRLLT